MKISTTPIKLILILSTILISSCDYYSPEVKKISEKYDIALDEAERCELEFGENTEKVLNWIEVNKSWFFGLFSENCDDLITQLPPFGRYDNLLAAKDNNWKPDDPAYKKYLIKRNKEIAEEEKIATPKYNMTCYKNGYQYGTSARSAMDGGYAEDIVISVECRNRAETSQGIRDGMK